MAADLGEACRLDSRRYYVRALLHERDALEEHREAVLELVEDLRGERFYDGTTAVITELREAARLLASARAKVSRAYELLPPAVRS
jgi:hypothetical protein